MIQTAHTALGLFRVDEVNDVDRLDSYRLLWDALLGRTRGGSFFRSLDWLQIYWRHFGGDARLRVLVVLSRGKPIGILPMAVRRRRTRVGTLRVLGFPNDDWGPSYGPIGPDATATLMAGLRHLRTTRRDWDLLDLRPVDAAMDRGRTRQTLEMTGFSFRRQTWRRSPRIEFTGTWQQYWQSRGREWRQHVASCERRLAAAGRVQYVRIRPEGTAHGDGDPRWELYDACQSLTGDGHAADRDTRAVARFLRNAHEAAAHQGQVDCGLLTLDGRPVAFLYHYHAEGRMYGVQSGVDPQWSSLEPDVVLLRRMLEDGFRRGDRVYDFGTALAKHAQHWQTSEAIAERYLHYRLAAPRTQLLRMKHWLDGRLRGGSAQTPSAV